MKKSEQINELAAALAKAQSQIKDADKDGINPHFKSAYATLSSAWKACRTPLSANGLSIVQSPSTTESGNACVTTTLMHSSGQWIEDSLMLTPRDKTPQAYGSAITYAKRYMLMAMVGIAADEDDDGNAASVSEKKVTASVAPKQWKVTKEHLDEINGVIKNSDKWSDKDVIMLMNKHFNKSKLSEYTEMEYKALTHFIKTADPQTVLKDAEDLPMECYNGIS